MSKKKSKKMMILFTVVIALIGISTAVFYRFKTTSKVAAFSENNKTSNENKKQENNQNSNQSASNNQDGKKYNVLESKKTDSNSSKSPNAKEDTTKSENTLNKVPDYLINYVPQLKKINNLSIMIDKEPDPNGKDVYARDYYTVGVGTNASDKFTRYATFYVSKNLDKVLWYDTAVRKMKDAKEYGK